MTNASFFLIHALYVNLKFVIIIMCPWFIIRILNQNDECFPLSVVEMPKCFIVIKFLIHCLKVLSAAFDVNTHF